MYHPDMKAFAICGSPNLVGNTSKSLIHLLDYLEKEGFETEYVHIYEDHMIPCNCCNTCEIRGDGRCVNEDDRMNDYLDKMRAADVIILCSPSYFGTCTAQLKMFLERAGYCLATGGYGLRGKLGVAFATQERDGGITVFNELVTWMLRMGLTVIGTDPLPIINGDGPNDWEEDDKGIRALDRLSERIVEFILGE